MKSRSHNKWVALFPLSALMFSILSYYLPGPFAALKSWIVPLLSVVMFSMGMTLTWGHFLSIIKQPQVIGLGVLTQFLFMPFAAYWLSIALELSRDQMIGMVLVGASAGGTASNVICYLAKGNVALSVLLTTASTLMAIVATPAIALFYLREAVPVPFLNILTSILQIVLLPVLAGTTLNSLFTRHIDHWGPFFPIISSLSILLIIAIIVAVNATAITSAGPVIVAAVVLHNLSGLTAGYLIPRCMGYDRQICRTISIEVGMQNSGLSVALAIKYFSAMAALPGAVFSIWHNLSGSLLASFWGRDRPDR